MRSRILIAVGLWLMVVSAVIFLFMQDLTLMSEFFLEFTTLNRIKLVTLAIMLVGATVLSYGIAKD